VAFQLLDHSLGLNYFDELVVYGDSYYASGSMRWCAARVAERLPRGLRCLRHDARVAMRAIRLRA